MTLVRRREINTDTERKIIIALIVSSKFCKQVLPMLNSKYFDASYAKTIIFWVKNYFTKYGEAPDKHIQDIFEVERNSLKEVEEESIETLLMSLSDEFDKKTFNADYFIDEAIKFCKKKSLEMLGQKIEVLIELGKEDEAEEEIRNFKKVAKTHNLWVNPYNEDIISDVMEMEESEFFTLPGKLGNMLGSLERGFLVGIFGPMKRGKSFLLEEMGVLGVLSDFNVAYITAEMNYRTVSKRLYKRLTACGDNAGEQIYPTFDCKKNQDGSCRKRERTNDFTLLVAGEYPAYSSKLRYRVCTYCRDKELKGYIPETWFRSEKRMKIDTNMIKKKMKGLKRHYGDRMRILCYPRFEASIQDIIRDLDNLEYTEDFVPDIIITDYADIFRPSLRNLVGREALDDIWKMHANMASKRHALVFTGSQTTRNTLGGKNIKMADVSEDIRKLAHCDLGLFLTQTDQEKLKGVMRISMFHRHKEFSERKFVKILQNLSIGQVLLDSEYCWEEKNK